MKRSVPLLLIATLAGCRAGAPAAPPATQSSAAPAASPGRAPLVRARCDVDRAQAFPDWDAWARDTLHDGAEFVHLKESSGTQLAETQRMLRRGLEACDYRAPVAAMEGKVRALVPELRDLLDGANVSAPMLSQEAPLFRLMVVNALTELDPDTDYAPHLLPLLSHPTDRVRMGAAYHARMYRLASVRQALLDRVRNDPKAPVRRQAAESLFVLANVRPPFVHGHKGLTDAIDSDAPQSRERAGRMVEHLVDQRGAASPAE
jgi:hypothetical protein